MDQSPLDAKAECRVAGPAALDALLEATRALLWIRTPTDAKDIAADLVTAFGGTVVPAGSGDAEAMPVDLSFGDGEPVLPSAPPTSTARMLLERYLPSLVVDVGRALELSSQVGRFDEDASIDSLTRLANRRMVGRATGRLRSDEVVIMVDLDHFKQINDTLGHAAGDRLLRVLGRTIRATLRGRDFAGRYGGDEFVIILRDTTDPVAFLERFREAWRTERPYDVSFSAGVARVGKDTSLALPAADHAMYLAKQAGRDQWTWTSKGDDGNQERVATAAPAGRDTAAFVAFSQLDVPEGAQEQLESAFRDRLGAVERWSGSQSLEVWADLADSTRYVMVSWWTSPEEFRSYMRSDDHRRSHDRIPTGDLRPRPREFRRYRIVAR